MSIGWPKRKQLIKTPLCLCCSVCCFIVYLFYSPRVMTCTIAYRGYRAANCECIRGGNSENDSDVLEITVTSVHFMNTTIGNHRIYILIMNMMKK